MPAKRPTRPDDDYDDPEFEDEPEDRPPPRRAKKKAAAPAGGLSGTAIGAMVACGLVVFAGMVACGYFLMKSGTRDTVPLEGANGVEKPKSFLQHPGGGFVNPPAGDGGGGGGGGAVADASKFAIGAVAPEVELTDINGKPAKLSALKGRVVVLDIWATWCPPCRAMIPHERELVERLKGKPFTLVSISGDEEMKTLTDFVEKEPMPWTHWWAGNQGKFSKEWGIKAYPTIYVLDAKGVIRYKGVRGHEMDQAVDTLLKEMGA